MYYPYSSNATLENWLHDCIAQMLRSVHEAVERGDKMEWNSVLSCLPRSHAEKLRSRRSLKDRLVSYHLQLKTIRPEDRLKILTTFTEQNRIGELLSGIGDCSRLGDLPLEIHNAAKLLFESSFKLLAALGIRKRQYEIAFRSLQTPQCPFCWIESFDDPDGASEDADHYLALHLYPFAGSNLLNLPPMCQKCNERYKRTEDILRDGGGRRKSFILYSDDANMPSAPRIRVSLAGSTLHIGTQVPAIWKVSFLPRSEEVQTWEAVFHTQKRYERALKNRYLSWMQEFSATCRRFGGCPSDKDRLLNTLDGYIECLEAGGPGDKSFLRIAMFDLIRDECRKGHTEVLEWVFDFAYGGRARTTARSEDGRPSKSTSPVDTD